MAVKKRSYLLSCILLICVSLLLTRPPLSKFGFSPPPGEVPSDLEIQFVKQIDYLALSYFYALKLLHAGDLHGQHVSLDLYDYDQVLGWLKLLTQLNPSSEVAPFLATFYFAATPKRTSLYLIIQFLQSYAKEDINARWRWYSYAIYLAQHHLHDIQHAYQMACDLSTQESACLPLWVKEMPGMLLVKMGQADLARHFFLNLLNTCQNLSQQERQYLRYKLESLN